jgi:hypothetical protein
MIQLNYSNKQSHKNIYLIITEVFINNFILMVLLNNSIIKVIRNIKIKYQRGILY